MPENALERMQEAAQYLVGEHDFASFMASGSDVSDTVRRVFDCRVFREGNEVTVAVSGNGFLYHMVRILVGIFHKEYGCTLTEFINKQRIDRGIQLLQQTAKPVQEIAAECGIQDVNYFIKLFKKQTGFTPSRYRSQGNHSDVAQ